MTAGAQSTGLALLLGLGAIDLAALNLWVLPPLLLPAVVATSSETQTAVLAASEQEQPAANPALALAPTPTLAPTPRLAAPAAETKVETSAATTAPTIVRPSAPEPAQALPDRGKGPTAVSADRVASSAIVRFMKGTWWIGPGDRDQLLQLAGTAVGAGVSFEIDGYADESGPDELNDRISRARADAIAELLVRAGVDRARISLRAHGELPVVRGDGRDERRAELRVVREAPR
ncbi:MAG TPA: OmpA family protein [Polyangiales bacterium]|nr:OmpA family protein [Polyangiales bacterium]